MALLHIIASYFYIKVNPYPPIIHETGMVCDHVYQIGLPVRPQRVVSGRPAYSAGHLPYSHSLRHSFLHGSHCFARRNHRSKLPRSGDHWHGSAGSSSSRVLSSSRTPVHLGFRVFRATPPSQAQTNVRADTIPRPPMSTPIRWHKLERCPPDSYPPFPAVRCTAVLNLRSYPLPSCLHFKLD